MLSPRTARLFIGKLLRQVYRYGDRYGGVLGKSLEILISEGVRGLGPEIGNIDTGGPCGGGVMDRYR